MTVSPSTEHLPSWTGGIRISTCPLRRKTRRGKWRLGPSRARRPASFESVISARATSKPRSARLLPSKPAAPGITPRRGFLEFLPCPAGKVSLRVLRIVERLTHEKRNQDQDTRRCGRSLCCVDALARD